VANLAGAGAKAGFQRSTKDSNLLIFARVCRKINSAAETLHFNAALGINLTMLFMDL